MKTCQVSVQLDSVSKSFDGRKVLDIDSFTVQSGELLGLVGNNGAGKTTMLRTILDLLLPDTGKVTVTADGRQYVTSQTEDWKWFTGTFIDSGFLIDYMTVREYFTFVGKLNSIAETEVLERLKTYDSLLDGEVYNGCKLIRDLSAGNRQKVGIVAAILPRPSLLILDEPFNFLDPSSQIAMKHLLQEYNRMTGATVIVSSHNLSYTLEVSTRVALIEDGRIIMDHTQSSGKMSEVQDYFERNVRGDGEDKC